MKINQNKDLSPVFINLKGQLCEIIDEDNQPFTQILTCVDCIVLDDCEYYLMLM